MTTVLLALKVCMARLNAVINYPVRQMAILYVNLDFIESDSSSLKKVFGNKTLM